MVVLRALAGHFVERLAPTGMLLTAAFLTGSGLFLLSFASGTWSAFAAATVFAWGVAFFFPTMVGVVSEKMPRTGSLGIVLTAGVGLGMAGAVGVPLMGKLADRYLAESLPPPRPSAAAGRAAVSRVRRPGPVRRRTSPTLGYRQREVEDALLADPERRWRRRGQTGSINNDAAANALRAIVATAIPERAAGRRGQRDSPAGGSVGRPALLPLRGARGAAAHPGVRGDVPARPPPRRLSRGEAQGRRGAWLLPVACCRSPRLAAQTRALRAERLRVLFLGDNGHHQPTRRAKELLPVLASDGDRSVLHRQPRRPERRRARSCSAACPAGGSTRRRCGTHFSQPRASWTAQWAAQPSRTWQHLAELMSTRTVRSDRSNFRTLFDAADAQTIVDRWTESTVAPQALFLLNSPFALCKTKSLAELAMKQPGDSRGGPGSTGSTAGCTAEPHGIERWKSGCSRPMRHPTRPMQWRGSNTARRRLRQRIHLPRLILSRTRPRDSRFLLAWASVPGSLSTTRQTDRDVLGTSSPHGHVHLEEGRMRRFRAALLAGAAAAGLAASDSAMGVSIGVNFAGGRNTTTPNPTPVTGTAGVVPQGNWNNEIGTTRRPASRSFSMTGRPRARRSPGVPLTSGTSAARPPTRTPT